MKKHFSPHEGFASGPKKKQFRHVDMKAALVEDSLSKAPRLSVSYDCELERQEKLAKVRSVCAQLTRHEKEALEAYARVSKDSCRKLAKLRGVSPGTICKRAKAAIAKIKKPLEDYQ